MNPAVIIPFVAVLALGLVVWLSGTPLSGSAGSAGGVTLVADSGRAATLTVDALDPGESVSRSVAIQNPESVDSRLSFAESGAAATGVGSALHLVIEQDGRQVYSGEFGAMSDLTQDMGYIPALDESVFTFTVSLPADADPVATDGAAAGATYSWVTVP